MRFKQVQRLIFQRKKYFGVRCTMLMPMMSYCVPLSLTVLRFQLVFRGHSVAEKNNQSVSQS